MHYIYNGIVEMSQSHQWVKSSSSRSGFKSTSRKCDWPCPVVAGCVASLLKKNNGQLKHPENYKNLGFMKCVC